MNILKIWQHPDSNSVASVVGPRYLITTINFLNLLVSCVYLITNLRLGIDPLINLVQISGSLVTLASLRFHRSHAPAAHIFLGMAVLNACSLIFTFIDFPYTILMWVPVYTILAVYIAGMLAGGIWSLAGITCVALTIVFGKDFNPHPVPIAPQDLPAITVITLYLTGLSAFIGSMVFARSIRHLVQIQQKRNEEVKEQNQIIQAYAQDKAMLVSILVHDIATPLTIILHSCDAIQNHGAAVDQALPRVQKATRMIEEISRSVREYQSVESGRTPVVLSSVDLRSVFERMHFVFEDLLQEKSLQLKVTMPDDQSFLVLADEESLSNSVINNLISNAIKFSHPEHTIDVSAKVDGDCVELAIRDYGVGIPESKKNLLFTKRISGSSKGTFGEKGTGYGLPIAKAYLDKYGAAISVESIEERQSPENHGTTFTLRLRRAPSQGANQ